MAIFGMRRASGPGLVTGRLAGLLAGRLAGLLAGILAAFLLAAAPAAAQDPGSRIEIYWDPGLTITQTQADYGDTLTAYVVLATDVVGGSLDLFAFPFQPSPPSYMWDIIDVTSPLGDLVQDSTDLHVVRIPDGAPLTPRMTVATVRLHVLSSGPAAITCTFGIISVDGSSRTILPRYRSTDQVAWYNTRLPRATVTPADMDFPTTGLGVMRLANTQVTNTGQAPIFLDYSDLDAVDDFALPAPGFPGGLVADVVGLGESAFSSLGFVPTVVGERVADISLGTGLDLHLHGIGREPIHLLAAPDTVAFPTPVDPGIVATTAVTVTNSGDFTEDLTAVFTPAGAGFSLDPESATTLEPAESKFLIFRFTPPGPGPASCTVNIGDGALTIALTAEGTDSATGVTVTPAAVNCEGATPGGTSIQTLAIQNTSYATRTVEPVLDDPAGVFNLASRTGDTTLLPGEVVEYEVLFRPLVTGEYTATVHLGDGMPDVPLSGVCADVIRNLTVSPAVPTVVYPAVGQTGTGTVLVTNTGLTTLSIEPRSFDSRVRSFSPRGPFPLAVGESVTIAITARTTTYGRFLLPIFLTEERDFGCDVALEPDFGFGPDENRLAVYFDAEPGNNHLVIDGQAQVVWAYLALLNPDDPFGVAGWECRLSASEGAFLGQAELSGNAIDADPDPGGFVVGLAYPPLPPAPATVLGRVQCVVFDMSQSLVTLRAGAVANPSVPGLMSWVPASAPETLMAMQTVTGTPDVAWIDIQNPVGVEAPAPTCLVDERGVVLTWPDRSGGAGGEDGYHVQRRGGDGSDLRLTTAPVHGQGGVVTFIDPAAEVPAGAALNYRYILVAGGREVAQSPETAVDLAAVPAYRTRLVRNVPNPFNPETVIRYEIGRRGPVRVRVFDLTGRVVRTLASEVQGPGGHDVTWDGRDGSGAPVASGVYYVRLETDGATSGLKVMLLK